MPGPRFVYGTSERSLVLQVLGHERLQVMTRDAYLRTTGGLRCLPIADRASYFGPVSALPDCHPATRRQSSVAGGARRPRTTPTVSSMAPEENFLFRHNAVEPPVLGAPPWPWFDCGLFQDPLAS